MDQSLNTPQPQPCFFNSLTVAGVLRLVRRQAKNTAVSFEAYECFAGVVSCFKGKSER